MNEAMRGEIIEKEPEENVIEMPEEFLETPTAAPRPADAGRPRIDTEKAQEIFFGLVHDASPGSETDPELGPEEEEIFKMILPALERLVQQVERTFEHYAANIENERVEKIFISSGIRPHRRIVDYIGDELGLPRETFDPFTTEAQFLGDITGPASDAERGAFAPAMGMALSDNAHTPNFLHTFKEKARVARNRLFGRIFMGCFLAVMAGCVGYYLWQGSVIDNKRVDVSQLKGQLKRYKMRVDQKLILSLVEKARQKNEDYREFSRKFMGLVVLTEISNRTPSNVRLTSISVQVSGNPVNEGETVQKNLRLEGIVLGDRLTMEASLASYLLALSDSPLFDKPAINKKEIGFFYDKEVLKFDAQLNLL
jgi:Tfp pilus assembly protein PilN